MKYEFAAPSLRDSDNPWAASSRLLNLYREPIGPRTIVKPVLGTVLFGSMPGVFCRAMATVNGTLYVVHGERFYSVGDNGVAIDLGAIPDDPNTTISGNNGKVTICAGGNYYLWDGTTLTEPAPGAFTEFGSVTFYKQLTVLTELGGRRVQWSNPAAPATLNGLSFATAESTDDDILRAELVGGSLMVFKTSSIETWASYRDGSLAAVPGSTNERGLKAFSLLTSIPNGVFFVGSDGVAYLGATGGMTRVSTSSVETSIAQEEPQGAIYYEDEGHKFCALLFDSRPAWVYDIATGEWHERAEGNDLGPWSVQACTAAYGRYIVGTKTGFLAKLSRVGQDMGKTMVKRAIGMTFGGELDQFRVHEFGLPVKVGVYPDRRGPSPILVETVVTVLDADGLPVVLLDDDGNPVTILSKVPSHRPPVEQMIELRVSGDDGLTWSDPDPRGLGAPGDYRRRVSWRRLGQYDQFTAEITYAGQDDITFDAVVEGRAS